MLPTVDSSSWRAWRLSGGKIHPWSGGVPLDDRGFRYGQHVFESIAIRQGRALLVPEHLLLLGISAKRMGIPCSRNLITVLRGFLKMLFPIDGMLRLYLTAGVGAPGSRITNSGCYLTLEATKFPNAADLQRGIPLAILTKPLGGEAWGIKDGNYARHVQALQEAHLLGAEEGIVRNGQGNILSCAMGNILVWMPDPRKKNHPMLCTPPAGENVRTGAVLSWVRRHTPVSERKLRPADLLRALALAVTNSRLGVMPVAAIDGRVLPDQANSIALAQEYLRKLIPGS